MNARSVRRPATERVIIERADPRLLRSVQQVALAGLALVLVWPAARGSNAWLGWLPMWLVGMPLVAWWPGGRCCASLCRACRGCGWPVAPVDRHIVAPPGRPAVAAALRPRPDLRHGGGCSDPC